MAVVVIIVIVIMMMIMTVSMLVTARMIMVVLVVMVMMMVVVIVMVMHHLTFFDAIYFNSYVSPCHTAFNRLFLYVFDSRDAEGIQLVYEFIWLGQELEKGCSQHVSRGAHAAVQV